MGSWEKGLRTVLCGTSVTTSNWGNQQDSALVTEIVSFVIQKDVSLGKAMAALDAARTAIFKRAMDCKAGSLGIDD